MKHLAGWLTPAALFYRRNHFPYPQMVVAAWRLEVGGLAARPLRLSLSDLRALPRTSRWVTLECSGNKRRLYTPPAEGTPWGDGAIGNAEWGGVPLGTVLRMAGPLPGVREVVFTGADTFARSLPLEAALDPGVLLALEMNGQPLPFVQGAPARLVVPRWYGMAAVKWVTSVELIKGPFRGRFQAREYVYLPRPEAYEEAVPVTTQRVNATITYPRDGARVKPGPLWVRGAAWGGTPPLRRVEVSLDGGAAWAEAEFVGPEQPDAWRLWQFRTESLGPGRHIVLARATDAAGVTQPREAAWNAKGYGNNQMPAVEFVVGLLSSRRE